MGFSQSKRQEELPLGTCGKARFYDMGSFSQSLKLLPGNCLG